MTKGIPRHELEDWFTATCSGDSVIIARMGCKSKAAPPCAPGGNRRP
ncbi:hypothetical protein CDEF62S_02597 [Castellaniella defragrans]